MTYHPSPYETVMYHMSRIKAQEDGKIRHRLAKVPPRKSRNGRSFEEKMKDPNYRAAVEFNKRNGLGDEKKRPYITGIHLQTPNNRKGRISLPKISMPITED